MVTYTDGKREWSGRYFVDFDKPCGYYDLSLFTDLSAVPDPEDLLPLTEEQWESRMDGKTILSKAVIDGKWTDYVAPIVPLPLKIQATNEMTWINEQAATVVAMGDTFTDDMKTYVKAVRAIVNGTDTASTALPTRPETITT